MFSGRQHPSFLPVHTVLTGFFSWVTLDSLCCSDPQKSLGQGTAKVPHTVNTDSMHTKRQAQGFEQFKKKKKNVKNLCLSCSLFSPEGTAHRLQKETTNFQKRLFSLFMQTFHFMKMLHFPERMRVSMSLPSLVSRAVMVPAEQEGQQAGGQGQGWLGCSEQCSAQTEGYPHSSQLC